MPRGAHGGVAAVTGGSSRGLSDGSGYPTTVMHLSRTISPVTALSICSRCSRSGASASTSIANPPHSSTVTVIGPAIGSPFDPGRSSTGSSAENFSRKPRATGTVSLSEFTRHRRLFRWPAKRIS